MKINAIQLNNPYLERTGYVQKPKLQEQPVKSVDASINNNEVKFFQKLFPANAQQIESYVKLNQNRKLIDANINKGSILDAKI